VKRNYKEENYNRLNNHFVFIGVFNFLVGRLEFEQALFHSCLAFPKTLGQIIHFYKSNYVDLIKTSLKSLQTISSMVAY
jgi:hypothetical protein